MSKHKPGTVYLVGAGPGDPGLMTLRAVECLERADLVLYDYLVNPAVLEHASPTAELSRLGHHNTGRALTPDGITTRMVEAALSGRTVVRLKGGDASIFGRTADETDALRQAGIPFEIVPGITTALAVAAFCEVPITHHADASAVALVTGRERDEKSESSLDYEALARFPGTLVLYMGVKNTARWSQALIKHGKPPDTPVAIVRWCSRPQQETFRCTLETATETVSQHGIRPPTLFVVGKVVDHAPRRSWFAARPLMNRRILAAGSAKTSRKARDLLAPLGADVVGSPAIRITDPPDWKPVDAAIAKLDQFDWLVFCSLNGVDYFFRRLLELGGDVRLLANVKLAAIGSGTAEQLSQYYVKADLVPEQFNAEGLAAALVERAQGKRFLLAQASRGRSVLFDELERANSKVEQIVVYGSEDVEKPDPETAASLAAGEFNWVMVTSPAIARSLVNLYGDALGKARLASISPLTSAALRDLRYEPTVEASVYTIAGLAESIIGFEDRDA